MIRGLAHAALYALLTLVAWGCASGTTGIRQAATNIATLDAAGYKALDATDAAKQAAIRDKVLFDRPGAMADFDAWKTQRAHVRTVLNEAQDAVEVAAQLCDDVDAGLKAMPPAAGWLAELIALAAKVSAALMDAGVKLPTAITSLVGGR